MGTAVLIIGAADVKKRTSTGISKMHNLSVLPTVMAGLGPAIHEKKLVDPRAKPGDDGLGRTKTCATKELTCST